MGVPGPVGLVRGKLAEGVLKLLKTFENAEQYEAPVYPVKAAYPVAT